MERVAQSARPVSRRIATPPPASAPLAAAARPPPLPAPAATARVAAPASAPAAVAPAASVAVSDTGLDFGEWKCPMCCVINNDRRWCIVCGHALDPTDDGLEPEEDAEYIATEPTEEETSEESIDHEAEAAAEAARIAIDFVRQGGGLYKRGGFMKSWKQRWVALTTDADGRGHPMLTYSKGSGIGRAIGSFPFTAVVGPPARVGREEVEAMRAEFAKSARRKDEVGAFGVVSEKRTYWFAATVDETVLWLVALRAILAE